MRKKGVGRYGGVRCRRKKNLYRRRGRGGSVGLDPMTRSLLDADEVVVRVPVGARVVLAFNAGSAIIRQLVQDRDRGAHGGKKG